MRVMQVLVAALIVSAVGCYIPLRPSTVQVGDSQQAKSCFRECLTVINTCETKCPARGVFAYWRVKNCKDACADQRDACLLSCPA